MLLALGWWGYRRAAMNSVSQGQVAGANASVWVLFREAIYHEVHWAFYRNAPIVTLHEYGGDVYWGIWAGLTIVALEAILNPAWRRDLTDPQRAPARLVRVALAIVSGVLFFVTDFEAWEQLEEGDDEQGDEAEAEVALWPTGGGAGVSVGRRF